MSERGVALEATVSAHLRPLPTCVVCHKPATEQLFNTVNAPQGHYCARHATPALEAFIRAHPSQD